MGIELLSRKYLAKNYQVREIQQGPYKLYYIIIIILYDQYHMVHMIWPTSHGPYDMANIT